MSRAWVTVDTGLCVGAGMCALIAPEVFDQNDEGISVVLDADPPVERHDRVRETQQACPARAIRLGSTR
ncbi:ferredoxin [Nocardia callitridis]|uniref:ferredoxin n=1 Tax=Nocardia callitridis TaxID=648753 RepID=UPI0031ED50F6